MACLARFSPAVFVRKSDSGLVGNKRTKHRALKIHVDRADASGGEVNGWLHDIANRWSSTRRGAGDPETRGEAKGTLYRREVGKSAGNITET